MSGDTTSGSSSLDPVLEQMERALISLTEMNKDVAADLGRCRQRLGGLVGDGRIVVFCEKKNSHFTFLLSVPLTIRRLRS